MLVDLSLGFLFCSIDLYFCLCASSILSWWLWLCSRVWSQAGWFLQFHSSFSRLLWLFEVFCISIQIVYFFFFFLRTLHTVLHSGSVNLHSHQQFRRVPFSPHPLKCLLFVDFWWWPFWLVIKWYLIVILICIPLIMSKGGLACCSQWGHEES